MKQFLKFFTASCLGTIVALFVLGFILFTIGMSTAPKKKISSNSILQIDLKNPVPEKTDNVRDEGFFYGSFDFIGLQRIKDLINYAKTDDRIDGIVLRTEYPSVGPATALALRNAFLDFKQSDKFIISYGDFFSQTGYYIATAADSVYINPNGSIDLRGFSVITLHFKNIMEKLGINMNVYYAGKYKGATESFRRENMSPENKYQLREYLNELKNEYFTSIASARDLSFNDIDHYASHFSSTNSDSALSLNLVDGIFYAQEFENHLKKKTGLRESSKIKYVNLVDYHNKVVIKKNTKAEDRIAVVHAEGEILYNTDENGVISFKRYQSTLERIARTESIKGVVLRVNSPGGVGFVADNIWWTLQEIKNSGKFLTVSMGDYAASGGYYISCMADTIVAENVSLTGSIGVYVMFPEINELLNNKLGVTLDSVKTNPYAVSMSTLYPQRPADDRILQQVTDEMYAKFLGRVAEGRNISMIEANDLGQGRIWSGKKAKEIGLVDEIGGLEDAIRITADRLGLEEYRISEYPTIKTDIYKELLKTFRQSMLVKSSMSLSNYLQLKKIKNYINSFSNYNYVQTRLPFFLN